MKTFALLTLILVAMLFAVTPALASLPQTPPQTAPQTESDVALPPLPENVQKLLKTKATTLDTVLDLSFAPALTSAKLYFRTNNESGVAFLVHVLVGVAGDIVTFPNFNENTVLGVRQVGADGIIEEWINRPLLERLAEKLRKE